MVMVLLLYMYLIALLGAHMVMVLLLSQGMAGSPYSYRRVDVANTQPPRQ